MRYWESGRTYTQLQAYECYPTTVPYWVKHRVTVGTDRPRAQRIAFHRSMSRKEGEGRGEREWAGGRDCRGLGGDWSGWLGAGCSRTE